MCGLVRPNSTRLGPQWRYSSFKVKNNLQLIVCLFTLVNLHGEDMSLPHELELAFKACAWEILHFCRYVDA